jgi:peptidyl-prolyl cis-trans isomerase SurA
MKLPAGTTLASTFPGALRRAATLGSVIVALVAGAVPARAQQDLEVIDRIAAVVGTRIILLSEVDEELNRRRAGGLRIPEEVAALLQLRRQVLEELIDNEVVYQFASRDTTIHVTDAEVQQGVDEQVRQVRSQFRTDAEMRAALAGAGFGTTEEWRRMLARFQREDLFRQRYYQRMRQEGRLRGGSVSDSDLRQAYQEAMQAAGGQRPTRPPSIAFRQIAVAPRATEDARRAALLLADSVKREIERGADFAAAARRHSDDRGSREQGGDLGWFRREAMVREFADVAFSLRPGVVSPVVRTPFGYHLIMVDRIQPAEVKARHILFAPEITPVEIAAAQVLAESLAAVVRGGASIDSLARIHGDSMEQRLVGPVDRTQLDSSFARHFVEARVGDIVGPFLVSPDDDQHRLRVVVAQVTELEPAREFTFEELRERIRQQLSQQRAIQNLYQSLRRRTYIDIRL